MNLPNTIDNAFPVKAEATFWWSVLAPGACPNCSKSFERDATQFMMHKSGRLAVKCIHCSAVATFGLTSG